MLVAAKARPFAVCGRIPVDPTALILFFRSKVSLHLSHPELLAKLLDD